MSDMNFPTYEYTKPTMGQIVGTKPVVDESHKIKYIFNVYNKRKPVTRFATESLKPGMRVRINDRVHTVLSVGVSKEGLTASLSV